MENKTEWIRVGYARISKSGKAVIVAVKNCRTCEIGKKIMDMLDDSEGDVDLSGELCEGCIHFSRWTGGRERYVLNREGLYDLLSGKRQYVNVMAGA